jgi:S-adenosylmethionine:tRNA ribosyltransferase-isomerase
MEKIETLAGQVSMADHIYDLPDDMIAQYPLKERDNSKLLYCRGDLIRDDIFRNIANYIPRNSLLVFNNTRVIKARILFQKETGATIEVFCIEPLDPGNYEQSFNSTKPVVWKCIVGNLKKWKSGNLTKRIISGDKENEVTAEKAGSDGESIIIRFRWDNPGLNFGEIIEKAGRLPLPPYIKREDDGNDAVSYQTLFSRVNGSVAAPTAGLHFTGEVLDKIRTKGISSVELTLHIGAGTFKPVKTSNVLEHEMHTEHFFIDRNTIEKMLTFRENILPVGTTSVRTLESLYWLGVKTITGKMPGAATLSLDQWESYELTGNITVDESLTALIKAMDSKGEKFLHASTRMMIIPGYNFRMISGLITNFHQPGSTLLLLVSAFTGKKWKKIYDHALRNGFRFLSYGDASLILR